MSFFTDLFEGNFGNLGNDLGNTFSSLANHPDQLAETLGVGSLVAAPFLLPELGAAIGIGGAADAGAAAGAADIGALSSDALASATAGDVATIGADASSLISPIGADALAADATSLAPSLDTGALSTTADASSTLAPDATNPAFDPSLSGGGTAAPGGGGTAPSTPASSPWTNVMQGAVNQAATTSAELSGAAASAPETASWGSSLSSILSSPATKLAIGAAPLALTLAMGEQQLPASAQALQAQALQMQQLGITNLNQAQAGILNAGQTAQITNMQRDLTNQWRQTLFNQGVQDPSKDARWPQIEAAIDSQVTAATAQLIQQNITNALAETGQASSALTSIAQMQMTADQNFTNNLVNATKALATVGAGSQTLKLVAA